MNLKEKIFKVLQEQGAKKPNNLNFDRIKQSSDYLGKGGGFEKSIYKGKDSEEYVKILSNKKPSDIKKVRLIFPIYKWEEIALRLIKSLGIVTGIFKSLSSAKKFIETLKEKGVKVDEFVVGSHGNVGQLLTTRKEQDRFQFDNTFLDSFKDILHSGSKVFFTACYGADYLDSLKDAAERLGVGVYGSAGIYNYITNESEKGYYWCSAKKFQKPKQMELLPWIYRNDLTIIFSNEMLSYRIRFAKIKITIKDEVFNKKISPFSFKSKVDERGMGYSWVRDDFYTSRVKLQLALKIREHLDSIEKDSKGNSFFYRKLEELLNKKNKFWSGYIREKFLSDEIVVEIELNGKMINVKSLPPVVIPDEITNEYLLEKGLCKKVNGSPISWV